MAKYRIKIEVVGNDNKIDKKLLRGIECDGFLLIADHGNRSEAGLYDMSVIEIAESLAQNEKTIQAAILTKAIYEADQVGKSNADIIATLVNGMEN